MYSSRKSSLASDNSFAMDELQEPLINQPGPAVVKARRRPSRRKIPTARMTLYIAIGVIIVLGTSMVLLPSLKHFIGYPFSVPSNPDHATTSTSSFTTRAATGLRYGFSTRTTSSHLATASVPATPEKASLVIPNIYDPEAVDAQTICPGYVASGVTNTSYGFVADLTLAGPACNAYGIDIVNLNLTVEYQSVDRISVRITPAYISETNYSDYFIQPQYLQQPLPDHDAASLSSSTDMRLSWSNSPSFNFEISRRSTGDTIFSTKYSTLVFEDQFIEFKTALPNEWNLQGLGETMHSLRLLNNHNITIYAADDGDPIDRNIYGAHPFYMETRYRELNASAVLSGTLPDAQNNLTKAYESHAHGVYLRNTHGQEVLLRDKNLTWRTIGGSIDLYIFSGPTPQEVTKQYVSTAAGLPAMQPYWSFGYHHCRWGYRNWSELANVVDSFRKFDIPLETIWTDIDYMKQYRDFENDDNTFPYKQGRQFLSELHRTHQHYVPIIDSAIYVPNPSNMSDAYETFTRGNDSSVFISNPDGSLYIGAVWPGFTAFPDWRAVNAQVWWTNEMRAFHESVAWDGIWIDMSEASCFCAGSCGTGKLSLNPAHPPWPLPGEIGNIIYSYPEGFDVSNSSEYSSASSLSSIQASKNRMLVSSTATAKTATTYLRTTPTPGVRNRDYPPYALNNIHGALPNNAISPSAIHADGASEYSIHSLFGTEILNATYNALLSVFPGKRPFIIGRSTFVGSGTKAGHWGGDNVSLFMYMAMSIPQALQMSLFGIPFFGVDTCGFSGNSDLELCSRWMQLSAFFPFYRNHNVLSANSQEPYVWAEVAEATKTAMSIRYSLLPYIYTIFHKAHITGSTVLRALAWEFPLDPLLASIDRQFMLGGAILITPVLTPLETSVAGIFPGSSQNIIWYDWYTQTAMPNYSGANITIPAPLGHIPVYIRGGIILPLQQPGYTTSESRTNPWSLLVALDSNDSAAGELYLDDGESIEPEEILNVDFTLNGTSLIVTARGNYVDMNALENVTIMGINYSPTRLLVDGIAIGSISYNTSTKIARITGLQEFTSTGAWRKDWTMTWR